MNTNLSKLVSPKKSFLSMLVVALWLQQMEDGPYLGKADSSTALKGTKAKTCCHKFHQVARVMQFAVAPIIFATNLRPNLICILLSLSLLIFFPPAFASKKIK